MIKLRLAVFAFVIAAVAAIGAPEHAAPIGCMTDTECEAQMTDEEWETQEGAWTLSDEPAAATE